MSLRPFNVRAICWQCVTATLKPFELRKISEMAFVDARNLMAEKTGWSCRVRYLTANLLIAISFVALSNPAPFVAVGILEPTPVTAIATKREACPTRRLPPRRLLTLSSSVLRCIFVAWSYT